LKIAVISDIHSAAEHFSDSLDAARREGFDRLVILGDLFTYGPDPVRTLELAVEACDRDRAIFITGNHDLLYFAELKGDGYASRLPDWIRESVEWTAAQLGERTSAKSLPWKEEWQEAQVLFSHANPFGEGDWTYLGDEQSVARASAVLKERSLEWGIFGHVHRFRRYPSGSDSGSFATVGSIGQPRDAVEPFSQWAVVNSGPEFSIEQRRLDRDWTTTIESIRKTSMSDATKERLCRFYQ
jgi:predicted phosphodiesterase